MVSSLVDKKDPPLRLESTCRSLVFYGLLGFLALLLAACAPSSATQPAQGGAPVEQQPGITPAMTMGPAETPTLSPIEVVTTTVNLPPPNLCAPDQAALDPLSQITDLDLSPYGDTFVSLRGTYQNPKNGQQFTLTATASITNTRSDTANYLNNFLSNLKVCFEAIDTAANLNNVQEEVDPQYDKDNSYKMWDEKRDSILVEMKWEPSGEEKEIRIKNLFVVYFGIDPTIDSDRYDDFQAKCATSSYVQPSMTSQTSGSVRATLYKKASSVGSSSVQAGQLGAKVSNNNGSNKTTYDSRVSGAYGTRYTLYGSWTETGSGVSGSVCP